MSKKITKISFKEGGQSGVSIAYTTYDENGIKDKTNKDCPHAPHIAFTFAMQKLKWHMLFLTEFGLEDKFAKFKTTDQEERPEFRVCGVSVSGDGDKEGIVITGYKTLTNGLGFVFNTPNTKVESTEYKFLSELISDIEELKREANEYLGGKYGAVQGDLFKEAGEPAPGNE